MKNKIKFDLANKEWKEFVFEELFEINSTSSGIDRNKLINKLGEYPYLTRSDKNNGYDSFICVQSEKYSSDVANVITIGLDTQTVFYQPNKFYTGQNIQVLKSKKLNKHIAQFLIPLIKSQMEKFNWGGNGATLTRLKRSKLMLPINSDNQPDFDFMGLYMQQKEHDKLLKYNTYIKNRIEKIKNFNEVLSIDLKVWKEFNLQTVFETSKGNQNQMSSLLPGDIPLISAKNGNNGLKDFVSKNNKNIFSKHSISLNNDGDGGAGFSYYQPFDYLLDSHVTHLKPKTELSTHTLLFISRCITKQRDKFGHGYAINNNRLKVFKIMLPVDEKENPDYKYMENYMKKLEYEKLTKYLERKTTNAQQCV